MKSRFYNFLIFVLTFIFCIVLFEIALRIFAPQQLIILNSAQVWQPLDTLGWTVLPNAKTEINTGEQTIHYFSDADGFRIGQSEEIEDCEKRILYIGDSYLQAIQVEEENTLCRIIQKELGKKNLNTCYDNAGVLGYDPSQYLINLKRLLPKKNYDLVMVNWYLPNDCVDSSYSYYPAIPKERLNDVNFSNFFNFRNFGVNTLRPLNEWSERRFHSYVFIKSKVKFLFAKVSENAQYVPDQYLVNDNSIHRWDTTAFILNEIQMVADSYEAPVVFFLIPGKYQLDENIWKFQLEADGLKPEDADQFLPNKQFTKLTGHSIVDLTDDFLNSKKPLYGSTDTHFNENGHREAAKVLLPFVESALLQN